jgi:hypothetical protein
VVASYFQLWKKNEEDKFSGKTEDPCFSFQMGAERTQFRWLVTYKSTGIDTWTSALQDDTGALAASRSVGLVIVAKFARL